MATLSENVTSWLGRVELVARGVDELRRDALFCLDRGDPLQARAYAKLLLLQVPKSPVGLVILADACDALGFDDEAVVVLRLLCEQVPWRGEHWVRLAETMMRVGAPSADVACVLDNVLRPDMDRVARRRALLILADLDLAVGDGFRAGRWLDLLKFDWDKADIAIRRLEIALLVGDRDGLSGWAQVIGDPAVLDGRASLALGRTRWLFGEAGALDLLLRAYVLEAVGAIEALVAYLAGCGDVVEVQRIKGVLAASGCLDEPSFAVALAMTEGRDEDARRHLARIVCAGDVNAARSLYGIALDRGDVDALSLSLGVLGGAAPREGVAILAAHRALMAHRVQDALVALDDVSVDKSSAGLIAHRLRVAAYSSLVLDAGDDAFRSVLIELRKLAAGLDRLDLVGACEALVVEQRRPLRVAVVGEFNAGKSTFINALLGADVAPTGVLPTTASLHFLSWAQDPFARIVTRDAPDRIVPHDGLKGALSDLRRASVPVREVHICAPIERLRWIDVLDTPGFNAPDVDHVEVASMAVREAHVAVWVLDATHALKESERRVLARIVEVGTPVQVVVNKLDRIDADKVDEVMRHVRGGLESAGLESMGSVVCFSARMALAGRLGDEEAGRRSGWDELESSVLTSIVNRSAELMKRALRRKAAVIAGELALASGRGATEELGRRVSVLVDSSSRLLALDRTDYECMAEKLGAVLERIAGDMRPLGMAEVGEEEYGAFAYAESRLLLRLVGPMVGLLLEVSGSPKWLEPVFGEAVSSVLMGVSSCSKGMAGVGECRTWRVVRACSIASHDRLVRMAGELSGGGRDNSREARVRAMSEALGSRVG